MDEEQVEAPKAEEPQLEAPMDEEQVEVPKAEEPLEAPTTQAQVPVEELDSRMAEYRRAHRQLAQEARQRGDGVKGRHHWRSAVLARVATWRSEAQARLDMHEQRIDSHEHRIATLERR